MRREQTEWIVVSCTQTDQATDIGLKELDRRDRLTGYFRCIYHYIIRRNGELEYGHRDHEEPAMGLRGLNAVSISVCLVGGNGGDDFTSAQMAKLRELVLQLKEEYPEAQVRNNLYPNTTELKEIP